MHAVTALCVVALSGCASTPFLAGSGPAASAVTHSAPVRVVKVDLALAEALAAAESQTSLAQVFGESGPAAPHLGRGDKVDITVWEAPPAVLFAPGSESATAPVTGRVATLKPAGAVHVPVQAVAADGTLGVPFIERVPVAGLSEAAAANLIRERLEGIAHDPQVLVTVVENVSSTVTVVGSVNQSQRVSLSARGERVLDAVAAAGGAKERLERTTLQLSRGGREARVSLERLVREPAQNIALQAGDVVSLYYQPLSFTALGATGRNDEIAFEGTGLTLAQALGRVNGLADHRAAAKGVFIFRRETNAAGETTPVVYQVDLTDPAVFWAMQRFPMRDRDVMYVANAPAVDFEKFMSIIATAAYSLTNLGIKP